MNEVLPRPRTVLARRFVAAAVAVALTTTPLAQTALR